MRFILIPDVCVFVFALIRYDTQEDGKKAQQRWEQVIDGSFGDDRMKRIYPNMILQ